MYDSVLFDNDGVLTYLTELAVLERAIETTFAERAGVDSAFVRRSHCQDAELSTPATHEIEDLRALPDLVETSFSNT